MFRYDFDAQFDHIHKLQLSKIYNEPRVMFLSMITVSEKWCLHEISCIYKLPKTIQQCF